MHITTTRGCYYVVLPVALALVIACRRIIHLIRKRVKGDQGWWPGQILPSPQEAALDGDRCAHLFFFCFCLRVAALRRGNVGSRGVTSGRDTLPRCIVQCSKCDEKQTCLGIAAGRQPAIAGFICLVLVWGKKRIGVGCHTSLADGRNRKVRPKRQLQRRGLPHITSPASCSCELELY